MRHSRRSRAPTPGGSRFWTIASICSTSVERVERQIVDVALGRLGGALDFFVDAVQDLLERTREIAVLGDVAHEFVGEELLARREVEERDLIDQVVGEVAAVDGDWLVVLALFVLFAAAAGVESVEENLLPIDLVVGGLFFGRRFGRRFGLGGLFLRLLLVFLRLDHVEEGIVEELLLEMLLKVQERHVEQVHRLIQARIDLELLL